ncbi:MAG: metal ABC transporter permease [Actinomycetota bacterium]|nr:metal ABC transporter permease [Actinomycetota bacterium]
MSWLTGPLWDYAFFRDALAVAILAGAIAGALGAYVVVRRMSYIAHGLSHAVLGGAAVAGALHVNVLLGAGVWAFVSALLIERVARRRGLYADTAIGIVTTASFAIGVAVISAAGRWQRNLESFLFGNVLGVDSTDIVLAVAVAVVVAAVVIARYRPLLFVTFDREVAAIHGVRVDRYEVLFALLLTAGVVASMRVLGVLLVAAAVVIPPATARVLTDRFEVLVPLGAALGAGSAVPGLYLSWYAGIASGAAIVLVQAGMLAVAAAVRAGQDRRRPRGRQRSPAGAVAT